MLNRGMLKSIGYVSLVLIILTIAYSSRHYLRATLNALIDVEGYNKSSVPKRPKIHMTRYWDEKVRQSF